MLGFDCDLASGIVFGRHAQALAPVEFGLESARIRDELVHRLGLCEWGAEEDRHKKDPTDIFGHGDVPLKAWTGTGV